MAGSDRGVRLRRGGNRLDDRYRRGAPSRRVAGGATRQPGPTGVVRAGGDDRGARAHAHRGRRHAARARLQPGTWTPALDSPGKRRGARGVRSRGVAKRALCRRRRPRYLAGCEGARDAASQRFDMRRSSVPAPVLMHTACRRGERRANEIGLCRSERAQLHDFRVLSLRPPASGTRELFTLWISGSARSGTYAQNYPHRQGRSKMTAAKITSWSGILPTAVMIQNTTARYISRLAQASRRF